MEFIQTYANVKNMSIVVDGEKKKGKNENNRQTNVSSVTLGACDSIRDGEEKSINHTHYISFQKNICHLSIRFSFKNLY